MTVIKVNLNFIVLQIKLIVIVIVAANLICIIAGDTSVNIHNMPQKNNRLMEGYRIIEGDILVEDEIPGTTNSALDDIVQNSGIIFQNSRWPNGQIPLVISNDFGAWERNIIYGAMNEIMSNTCIKFQQRTWEPHYVFIQKHYATVCNSLVGRSTFRIPQLLTLGQGCINHWTVLHELVHVIGFYHEQNRADRDNYVTILWDNIRQANHHDFQKQSNSYDFGVGYDYKSIMHYAPTYFGFARRTTIVSKPPGIEFGNARHLSFRDILKISRMYGCRNLREESRS